MPRPSQIPTLRQHKPSNQAVVTLNGKDHYLGPWPRGQRKPPPEAKAAYDALIAEWVATLPSMTASLTPRLIHRDRTHGAKGRPSGPGRRRPARARFTSVSREVARGTGSGVEGAAIGPASRGVSGDDPAPGPGCSRTSADAPGPACVGAGDPAP